MKKLFSRIALATVLTLSLSGAANASLVVSYVALIQRPAPVFMDGRDAVRVWLPEPATPAEAVREATFVLDGREIPLVSAQGAERDVPANNPNFVVLPGSIQSAVGGKDWDPAGLETRMVKVSDGVFELVVELPAGSFEYKLARGGNWNENYGLDFAQNGSNIRLVVPSKRIVKFVADFNTRTIRDSINAPSLVVAPSVVPSRPDWSAEFRNALFRSVTFKLAAPLSADDIRKPALLRLGGVVRPVIHRDVLSDPMFRYAKEDLGSRWSPTGTTFKVWSPIATKVDLLLFKSARGPIARRVPMKLGTNGVWFNFVQGNLHGTYYKYELKSYGETRLAADINGFAASADSSRSMVVDLRETNPRAWPAPRLFQGKSHVEAILYETHVRDFTVQPESGVRSEWRGKYLGFTQTGTKIPGSNFPTGIDYLKGLGVTHVHLLPFQDFNPEHSSGYNWGYETTLFNVPEEQYATNRHDSVGRIRETKQMIHALQSRGLGVVLDVVYNHSVPSEGASSAFWQTVPYYYFRTNDRGDVLNESGVGNALHDERPMVRKYIRDSLKFWAREYRLDGFRFDLIGMFPKESNADFARAIRSVNPSAVIYGEPWTGGGPTRFGKGDQRGTGVAVFNDRFRGAFRGELDGAGPGFSMGGAVDKATLERVIKGSVSDFTDSPNETVNYVSAHDNLSFWDRVARSIPNDPKLQESAVTLAHAAVLLSDGMPFIEGGVEIGRTKGGNHNSYNAGDAANQFDWKRAQRFEHVRDAFKSLIAIRKRLWNGGSPTIVFDRSSGTNGIGYTVVSKSGRDRAYVYLNGSRSATTIHIPPDAVRDAMTGGRATNVAPPLSARILWLKPGRS